MAPHRRGLVSLDSVIGDLRSNLFQLRSPIPREHREITFDPFIE